MSVVYRDERVALEVLELAGRDGTTKRRAVLRHPGAVDGNRGIIADPAPFPVRSGAP